MNRNESTLKLLY